MACPLPAPIIGFDMAPLKLVDVVTLGWPTRTTLEPAADCVEGVPFDEDWFEDTEEVEVTRIYLVTWEISSVLLRFTPVLLMGSCDGTLETPELLRDGTTTLFCKVEGGKGELQEAVFTSWEILVATVETGEMQEARLKPAAVPVVLLVSPLTGALLVIAVGVEMVAE